VELRWEKRLGTNYPHTLLANQWRMRLQNLLKQQPVK
jgi:hypothetical protein